MKKKEDLPKELLVVRERSGDETWLAAYTNIDELPDDPGVSVGIYKLETIKTLKISKTY